MNFKGILRGTIFAYIIAAAVLFGAAAAVYFDLITDRTAGIAAFCGMLLGVFFGAFGAAKTAERRLLPNALAVSLAFSAAVFAAAMLINNGMGVHIKTFAVIGGVFAAGLAAALSAA